MSLNSFHDLNKFIDILSNEFGSGDLMFGGNVKRKDLEKHRRWLKGNFYDAIHDVIGSRTIAPEENCSLDNCSRIIATWIIAPQTIVPEKNCPQGKFPPGNCPPENGPVDNYPRVN